jgi:hypothetical protein
MKCQRNERCQNPTQQQVFFCRLILLYYSFTVFYDFFRPAEIGAILSFHHSRRNKRNDGKMTAIILPKKMLIFAPPLRRRIV